MRPALPQIRQSRPSPRRPGRARRSDAKRNTELLLAVAKDLLQVSGPEVALDEIARRAGIGNATLYRNFPTRADLLAAVYSDEVSALCGRGEALLYASSPVRALFEWLDSLVRHVHDKRALALAATQANAEVRTELFERWRWSITATASRLLKRAQDAGGIRSDVKVADLVALANAVALTSGSKDQARRLLRIFRNGIEIQT